MSQLYGWLAAVARRQARRSDLSAALLVGEGVAYARQRLAPVLLRLSLRTCLHAVEIYLLSLALPFEYLAPLLGYRALAQVASTAHWGALERLRREVREQARQHRLPALRFVIVRWLAAGAVVSALPVLFFVARVLEPPVSLFDAYGLACFARLACEVYARTCHAGVYALRRVYRPFWSLSAADVLELSLIVLGFDACGAWILPLAILASGALDAWLSLHYTRLAYRVRLWQLPRLRDARRAFNAAHAPTPPLRAAGEIALASLAHAATQLDGPLLLLLLRFDPPRASEFSLALSYYVLRPLFAFAGHWVRTFYFDLSRLEAGALAAFRAHLSRYLRRVGVGCAAAVAVLSVVAIALLWPSCDRLALACLVPLLFARALFAQRQLEAFVRRCYVRLLAVAALLYTGLLSALGHLHGAALLGLTTLLFVLAYALLPASMRAPHFGGEGGLAEWLRALRDSERVQVAVLRVIDGSLDAARVARALARADPTWRIARSGRELLLAAPQPEPLSRAKLIAASGGSLCELWWSPRCTGQEAVALAKRALPPVLARSLLDVEPASAAALVSEFACSFAAGQLIDLRAGTGRLALRQLSRPQLAEFTAQVVLACKQREATRRNRLPVQLAVYAPAGHAELLFVLPREVPGFGEFRARVRASTLHASLFAERDALHGTRLLPRWLAAIVRARDARALQS